MDTITVLQNSYQLLILSTVKEKDGVLSILTRVTQKLKESLIIQTEMYTHMEGNPESKVLIQM